MKIKSKMGQQGFSLIENLVSISILALVTLPLLNLFVQSAGMNGISRHNIEMAGILQQEIETMKGENYSQLMSRAGEPRYAVESYYVQNFIKPYRIDKEGSNLDIIIKKFDSQSCVAYIITPEGTLAANSSVGKETAELVLALSDSGGSPTYGYARDTKDGVADQQRYPLSGWDQGTPLYLNLFVSQKPNILPVMIDLTDFRNISDLKICIWDDYYDQSEIKISYMGQSGKPDILSLPWQQGGDAGIELPSLDILYDQTDMRHDTFVELKSCLYDSSSSPVPLTEMTAVIRAKH